MTDAPKTIWAHTGSDVFDYDDWYTGGWVDCDYLQDIAQYTDVVEYTRTDIAQAELAAAKEAQSAPRFGKTKYATIRRDFNKLRNAVNEHDALATEAAWEKCERWMEALPTKDQSALTVEDAAKVLLDAGCDGLPALTWETRKALNGEEPKYPAGDAYYDDKRLYGAMDAALRAIADTPKEGE